MLSVICESFGCLPSEALEEDPQMVIAILEHRLASHAKQQFNENAGKMSKEAAELWKTINFELKERGYMNG